MKQAFTIANLPALRADQVRTGWGSRRDSRRKYPMNGPNRINMTMRRIAFDLDETLGVPIIDGSAMINWQMRPGCEGLLDSLRSRFKLCLWSVSSRRYVDKALSFGLRTWFTETYSWDELPVRWKDLRQIRADYLVDDSPHHREAARAFGLESAYIVVPQYGSPEDADDPLAWARQIETAVQLRERLSD